MTSTSRSRVPGAYASTRSSSRSTYPSCSAAQDEPATSCGTPCTNSAEEWLPAASASDGSRVECRYHSSGGAAGSRPGRGVVEGHPQRGQHAAVRGRWRQQVHGRPVLAAARVGQRGEPRQPGQREVDLHRLPGRAPRVAVDPLPQRGPGVAVPEQPRQPVRVGGHQHHPRRHRSRPRWVTAGAPPAPAVSIPVTSPPVRISAPASTASSASRRGHRAHPAAHDHPGAARAGQPAHVVHQQVVPGTGRPGRAGQAGHPVGHRVHGQDGLGGEPEAAAGSPSPSRGTIATNVSRSPGRTYRSAVSSSGSGGAQPGRRDVLAQLGQLGPERLVGPRVGLGEELGELAAGRVPVGAQQQRAPVQWSAGSSAGRGGPAAGRARASGISSGGISPSR